jgi:hypothetical protein
VRRRFGCRPPFSSPEAGVTGPDAELVARWLAEHGGPRRFARGDSASPESLAAFLEARGYLITAPDWPANLKSCLLRKVGARGRPRAIKPREVIALVDEMRLAEGLEPIAPRVRP